MRYERENDANGESYFINALGSRMLGIGVSGNHVDGELYLDRRTGKVIPFVVQTPRTAPSLDVPAGRVRLCAPLRRPRDLFVEFIDEFREPVPATYQAPYLTYRWRGSVILRRCGTTRKLVLGHSPEDEPLLTHRFVAWQTERALHVFSLRTQATANLKLPSPRVLCANADDRYVVCRGADDHAWLADLGDTGRVRATRRPPPR